VSAAAEPGSGALPLARLEETDMADLGRELASYLARHRPAGAELAYFALTGLDPPLVADAAFDLGWSAAARAVSRAFARHLLGFRDSSPGYLWDNFLAGLGRVRSEPGHLDVQLPRSPLAMMLRLGGIAGLVYPVLGLAGVTVHLSLPEE
jgi:hypothetical protein